MRKNFKYYILAWVVLLVVFNVIVFSVPSETAGVRKFGGAFWIGYVFITLAFIGQLICAVFAFRSQDNGKLFLSLPLVTISYSALIISIIAGTVCMVIPHLPNWIGIVACALILGFSAIAIIMAKAASEIVSDVGGKVKAKTMFVKSLTTDAEALIAKAKTDSERSASKKVFEAIRYSDPMSHSALADLESQITLKFNAFADAIASCAENASSIAEEVIVLLNDRNKKCKLLK